MANHRDTFIGTLQRATQRIEAGETLPGGLLAALLKRLTQLEVAEGGPYALEGDTPDVGTNLAVARFLRACDVQLPNVERFLEQAGNRSSEEHINFRALPSTDKSASLCPPEQARMIERILECASERFEFLSDELREDSLSLIGRTIHGNGDRQMTLMAYFMREALGARGACFDDESIAQLGLANVFFWSSFIVYDDFWDEDESALPRFLPVANLFARQYVDFFAWRFPGRFAFRDLFHELMDKLDGANAWELAHCRMRRDGPRIFLPEQVPDYGDYSIKFYPAAGHTLGPLSMIVELGSGPGSPDFEGLIEYFKHYLAAMQINDDAHDWKEDLKRGHISTAVARLIEIWKQEHPDFGSVDFEADMPELEQLFWFGALEPLCLSALTHCRQSREALARVSLVEQPAPLEQFITRSEGAAKRALEENRVSRELIETFA